MRNGSLLPSLLIIALLSGCSSGKKAYDRGDYYDAVVKAVMRLKQKPDHDKSKETLKNAYPLAVQSLEQEAQNMLASSEQFKYRNTIGVYERINQLGETIKSSPAAMTVVRQPKNYYAQIGELKEKAADELYEAGIASLMRGTRKDAREAYFYFRDCEQFVPRYKEALEMMTKAEDDGTLKVMYEESDYSNWTSLANVVRSLDDLQFIALYNKSMAVSNVENKNTIHLNMLLSIKDYNEGRPQIKKKEYNKTDSVKTGEKVVNNQKVPVYEKVKGKFTGYEATARSAGRASVMIRDTQNGNIVLTQDFESEGLWSGSWGSCSGDQRAFDKNEKKLCEKGEQKPDYSAMKEHVRKELDKQMYNALASFLQNY